MTTRTLEPDAVVSFLRARFADVADVALLKGGGWSSAFGFRANDRQLVVRFGQHPQDYAKDGVAARWAGPNLPCPAFIGMGDAFGGAYAVSERLDGESLDAISAQRMPAVMAALFDVLAAIRDIELPGVGYGIWLAPNCEAPFASWREYLLSIRERDEQRLTDWRRRLAEHRGARAVFDRGCKVLERVVAGCPNVRKVVHNDLLNNMLVASDDRISALFDWGNALAGDPLYDVVWLSCAHRWYPGIERAQVLRLAEARFAREPNFAARIQCYELHLALDSMQYLAYAGRSDELDASVQWTTELLERLT